MEKAKPYIYSEYNVTIVEDDPELNNILFWQLSRAGFSANQIFSGESATENILKLNPTVVLLDWTLPGKSGEEICRNLRYHGFKNHIIMLTAKRSDQYLIQAYEFGATDYIVKPYSIEVLVAIIHNKIRFLSQGFRKIEYHFHNIIHYPLTNLILKKNQRIELTIIENLILHYLILHSDSLIPKSELEIHIWGKASIGRSRTLDMHLMRLRKKVEDNPDWPKIIVSIKGKGILFKLH